MTVASSRTELLPSSEGATWKCTTLSCAQPVSPGPAESLGNHAAPLELEWHARPDVL